jgi:cytochrome o ubiquinol oxidase subunit IV
MTDTRYDRAPGDRLARVDAAEGTSSGVFVYTVVFFLHITTGPDNTNNVLALAFGVLIVTLVVGGSLWIMTNLNDNMMPPELMNLYMQR